MTTNITTELGQATGIRRKVLGGRYGSGSSKFEAAPTDLNADLNFPDCLPIYSTMQNSSKIGGIVQAITLRITSMSWTLTGDGVRPEVMEFLKEQFGLAEKGTARVRHRNAGVNMLDHLEDALTALVYGFAPFEQVYTVGAPVTAAEKALGMQWITRLRKLAHRDPDTISEVGVGSDGGLVDIVQNITDTDGIDRPAVIPVDRLVVYTNGRRGGDWYGKSILRRAYRDWYFLDMLERIQAQIIERNGMGFPTFEYDANIMTHDSAMQIIRGIRAGEEVGAAWPKGGGSFSLQGVQGSTVDPLPAIQRYEQNVGKSMLAMFMDLGHDAGARSLGDTFTALFDSSLNAFADRFAETFTEHVIADLVAYNFGAAEPYPELTHGAAAATIGADAETLKVLSDAGFITPNSDDEANLRARLGMPEAKTVAAVAEEMDADELNKRVNAAMALISNGLEPADALLQSGLDPVKHLGLLPDVTNIPPADPAAAASGAGLSELGGPDLLARASAILNEAMGNAKR